MAEPQEKIETLEHRYSRAWLNRDERTIKTMTSRAFRLVFATEPPVLLDDRSWIDAIGGRFRCDAFRFASTPFVRQTGSTAIFAVRLEIDAGIDGKPVKGDYWMVDVWRKSRLRRRWQLAERILSKPMDGKITPDDIGALQQWRPRASRATSR
jgi:hypothetical protein